MSTATIKPKTGTQKQWTDSGRILEVNEWGVSVTSEGKYILKIGDGATVFDDLEPAVSTPYFEEILGNMTALHNEVMAFKNNMAAATNNATVAATNANSATEKANAAAKACEGIVAEQNTMTDDVAGVAYKLGVSSGNIYIEEVE